MPAGRWVLRRYIGNGKYRVTALGLADDAAAADGMEVLSFEQAAAKARAMVATPNGGGTIERLTVRQAMERYVEYKHHKGQPVEDTVSRSTVHILPSLGDLVVAELTAEQLRRWLSTMAAAPAQSRPRGGKPRFRAAPATAEEAPGPPRHRQSRAHRAQGGAQSRLRRGSCRQPRRLGPQAQTVRAGRGGARSLPVDRRGRAADQRRRSGFPAARARGAGDRRALR